MKKFIIAAIAFMLFLPFASAEIENFRIGFTISLPKIYVVQDVSFKTAGNFEIELPQDASQILLSVDGKAVNITAEKFDAKGSKIHFEYLTRNFIDKNNFVMGLEYPDDIKNLSITLNIPSSLELSKPIEEKALSSGSVFPMPSRIATDGQRMSIGWDVLDAKKGDSMSILVMLKPRRDYTYLIYILIALAVVAVIYAVLKRKKVQTIIRTRTRKIEEHLKEDEAQVVRILKSRERQCEQGTLRVVTGFSKAKLSGLLKELEDRKIIYKEKRGKKNIIFLK